MTAHKADSVPKKADLTNKASWYITVIELASKGISNRAIAARIGLTQLEFANLVEYEQNGTYPVREALELARAQFEIERVEMKDQMLNDPETSVSLKYKIIREDLKTLEEWAPATRSVKVQIEHGPTEFAFSPFTEEEIAAITLRSADKEEGNNFKPTDESQSTED